MAPPANHHYNAQDEESTEREDVLDQHVVYYLKQHPEFYKRHNIARVRPGVYQLDGREVAVDWDYDRGFLVVVDGPLRQPFTDYLQGNESNVDYDHTKLRRSNLEQVPHAQRLSFGESKNVYSRLEAMKIAKEQALVREQAAEYAKDGERVPQSALMERYRKTISQKLGNRVRRDGAAGKSAAAPVASPAPAEAPVATPPPAAEPAARAAPPQNQKHGSPVYCSNHNTTEKRPKKKPEKVECPSCGTTIQTNYKEFAICPECSQSQNRCMCCGASCAAAPPARSTQGQPVYCCNHNQSHLRNKVKPHSASCTKCSTTVETNYADFTLCHGCSQAEQRCMCCGESANAPPKQTQENTPPAVLPMPEGAPAAPWLGIQNNMQNLQSQGLQAFKAQASGLMYPQNPMASYNPMASQSPMAQSPMASQVMASFNVMASQYPVMSQSPTKFF